MDDEKSVIVVELAKEFFELVRKIEPMWSRAFFRFCSEDSKYGSNASYVFNSEAMLIDPFKHNNFFTSMNEKGVRLLQLLEKARGVFLIVIDSEFQYDIKFEYKNLGRWKITKINGGTGIPEDI